jgi:hypothetical protein
MRSNQPFDRNIKHINSRIHEESEGTVCLCGCVGVRAHAQCDGVEFEASANVMDLRYIPDDVRYACQKSPIKEPYYTQKRPIKEPYYTQKRPMQETYEALKSPADAHECDAQVCMSKEPREIKRLLG